MSVVVDEKRYDTALLLACAVLLFIGLTTLFSLGLAKSGNWFINNFSTRYWRLFFLSAPVVCRLVNGSKPPPIWPSARLRCCFSTLLFGDSHKGASRWIKVGLTMQPVEYFKFAFLLIGARQCARAALTNFGLDMIKPLFLWLFLPLFILLCQPDFGSFCLITAVAMVMLFLAGCALVGLFWRFLFCRARLFFGAKQRLSFGALAQFLGSF